MNITVYLGALEGKDHTLTEAVRELGTWIGENGHALEIRLDGKISRERIRGWR